jgi:peptidyl-prolyl cis-trans isomerase SurA
MRTAWLAAWTMALTMACTLPSLAEGEKVDSGATIYVLVDDTPITGFSIEQRMKLMSMDDSSWRARLQAMLKAPDINDRFKAFAVKHNPQTKEQVQALQKQFIDGLREQAMAAGKGGLKDRALVELIDDVVKNGEAKREGLLASDDEVNQAIASIAKRNNKTAREFEALVGASGVNFHAFKERIRTQMSWQRVLGHKFRDQVTVRDAEIQREVTSSALASSPGDGGIELTLQRILVPSLGSDASSAVSGYATADQLRQKAQACKNFSGLAKQVPGAKFEDIGSVRSDQLPPEIRPVLISAEVGSVPPPFVTSRGIEIYAVCNRSAASAGDSAKAAAKDKIEQDKLKALSHSLLSDLCAAASIEPRNGTILNKPCGSE